MARAWVALVLYWTAAPAGAALAGRVQDQLEQANRDFSYNGEPINPLVVRELQGWMSDGSPGPVAVDLRLNSGSNRYYGTFGKDAQGRVRIDMRSTEPGLQEQGSLPDTLSYQRIGTLPGQLHVLQVWTQSGGSGVLTHLLLVRFDIDFEYEDTSERGSQVLTSARRERLILRQLGEFPIADRYEGPVKVDARHNRIIVGPGRMCCGEHDVIKRYVIQLQDQVASD